MRLSGRSGMAGKLEPEGGAAAVAVVEADVALHHLDQALADREPEPGAAFLARGSRVGLGKAREDAAAEIIRDARPAVVHRYAQAWPALLQHDFHGSPFRGEFCRI